MEAAGANLSAISYHFGGKRPLYLATATYLAEKINESHREFMDQIDAELEEVGDGPVDLDRCRQLLQNLLQGFARALLTGETGEDAPGFILREQSHPTEAFDILYANLFEPIHSTTANLVGLIRGLPSGHREASLVAHALVGQIIAFRVARTTLLRRLGQQTYNSMFKFFSP